MAYEIDLLELGERPSDGLLLENETEKWFRAGIIWARGQGEEI